MEGNEKTPAEVGAEPAFPPTPLGPIASSEPTTVSSTSETSTSENLSDAA